MTELDLRGSDMSGVGAPGGLLVPERELITVEPPLKATSAPAVPERLPTTPVLAITVLSAAVAFGLAGFQIARGMNGEDRISMLSWIELFLALVAAAGTVGWTWLVVENARRLLAAGRTTEAPSPNAVAAAWAMPLLVTAAAVGATAYLELKLNTPEAESTSTVPLAVACGAVIVAMFVSYRPLFMLSAVMRRLGAVTGALARWIWVPLALAIAGSMTLIGLRAGGAYGDDFDGFAPAWALGIVAIPPVLILLVLAWRGGRVVEDAVQLAYDRRAGIGRTGVGRGRMGVFARLLRADARPAKPLDIRKRIRLVPGHSIVRLAMMTAIAALALVSVVGALVMFLFWRETADGALVPAQRVRAWTALEGLQSLERMLAVGLVGLASLWSFLTVFNARLASGRRRNPLLAALSWPAAAWGIWYLSDRYADENQITSVVVGFALQAAVLYVPFFLLERSAVAVGARRSPLRLSWALCVVLLVHIQGLGGLPTLVETAETDRFGRIAGVPRARSAPRTHRHDRDHRCQHAHRRCVGVARREAQLPGGSTDPARPAGSPVAVGGTVRRRCTSPTRRSAGRIRCDSGTTAPAAALSGTATTTGRPGGLVVAAAPTGVLSDVGVRPRPGVSAPMP